MVTKMHLIFCTSIFVLGLYGESLHASAQECSTIPLSDPTRVVVTPPSDGDNYFYFELVSLSCNSSGEYTFTGNDYSYCLGNNQWDPDPSTVLCYEKCVSSLIPDDVIQQDDEGNTTRSYYDHGDFIYLSCTGSKTLIGPSQITCLDGSIGDDTIACQGGTTTVAYTTKETTTAPSTTVLQEETTLAEQTIINTAMGSTTSNDGSFTDEATQGPTELLTSVAYITEIVTVTAGPTDTVTSGSTDVPLTSSTHFMSTDVITDTATNGGTEAITDAVTPVISDVMPDTVTPVVTDAITDIVTEIVTDSATEDVTDLVTDTVTHVATDAATNAPTVAVTQDVSDAITDSITDTITETVTEILTETVTYSATKPVTDFVTDIVTGVVTDSTTKAETEVVTEIVTYIATDGVDTELPETVSNDVTTLITDISATDDGATTSATAVTELISTRVTVVTEVVTEMNEITEFTTPVGSNMTTMSPNPCDFCDPDRERCVAGLDGPVCECLPGFYRIIQTKSDTNIQCTEAILFEVDARITKINGEVVDFTDDLNNSASARFNYLEDLICSALEPSQSSMSGFLACQVTSFSSGSIIAVIDLYFSELSNVTENEVYNETVAAFAVSNITAEVTRVELVVPSIPTTTPAKTPTRTTPKTTTITTTGAADSTSKTPFSTTQFITTAKSTKRSTADTTLLVIYILIPVLAILLLIVIGSLFYQNKKVSKQYGMTNPGGKKPKKSKKKTTQKTDTSSKETNGHVNIAFYNEIATGEDKATQTTKLQIAPEDRPDSGVVVEEDVDHMVYPYPWNEPGRLEADNEVDADAAEEKVIYAKVERKSTHKNPPVIVEIELQHVVAEEPPVSPVDWSAVDASFTVVDEIELQPVVAEEPQLSPVDWAAVDESLVAVQEETSVTEAVMEDSANQLNDPAAEECEIDNEEHEAKDMGSQPDIEEEPGYMSIGGFELNEVSFDHASTSKDIDALHLDSISLELTSSMETEIDRRFRHRSTPC